MVPMIVEKYGTRASTGGSPQTVRGLQLQVVADPDTQGFTEVLRQHHAATVEHLAAHLLTDRAEERVGGTGGKPVKHHAGATDLSEPE